MGGRIHRNTQSGIRLFAGSGGTTVINDYAWTDDNAEGTTHTAGAKLSNELGLFDMSGNVWEWCWDWYASAYPDGTIISDAGDESGRGPTTGTGRVRRGGSWYSSTAQASLATREGSSQYGATNNIGFRVVRQ